MKVVILAAGYATRLYPLTLHTPKALLPIKNRPLMSYILDKVEELGAHLEEKIDVCLVSNHIFYTQFQDYFKSIQEDYRFLSFYCLDDGTSHSEERLGALKDLKLCVDTYSIQEDILLLSSDNLFEYSLIEAYEQFKTQGLDLLFGKYEKDFTLEQLQAFAIAEIDEHKNLLSLEEKPKQPKSDLAVYATYFYKASTLEKLDTCIKTSPHLDSPGCFPAWLFAQQHPLAMFIFEGECLDIGTKEMYEKVK